MTKDERERIRMLATVAGARVDGDERIPFMTVQVVLDLVRSTMLLLDEAEKNEDGQS